MVRVPAITAVMTKMPTGKVRAMMCVMRSSARSRVRRMLTMGPLPSSSIRAKPRNRQKSTVAGIIPSDKDRKGLDGMNWSMKLKSAFTARSWVLKKEASTRGGNASWNEKYPTTQMTQNSRRMRNALRAIAFAVSRFRLPIPTIRERATEGRIVICQILMNASLRGFMTEQRSPKTRPVKIPRMKHSSIQVVRFRRGSLMVFYLRARGRWCTIGWDRRTLARQQTPGTTVPSPCTHGNIRHMVRAGLKA